MTNTGELRLQRCDACGWWLAQPKPRCPRCHGRELTDRATSGRATLWSFTTSRMAWGDGPEPPYVVAEVELAEQAGLRLLTNLVDCDEPVIGMPLRVRFEPRGDAQVPVFAP